MYYGSKIVEQVRCLPKYSELARNFDFDMWRKEVVHGTAMFIFNMDFSLEWPRALPPTIKFVGALLPEPAKPLPPNFEVRFLQADNWISNDGFLCGFLAFSLSAFHDVLSLIPHMTENGRGISLIQHVRIMEHRFFVLHICHRL
jgi:hypothetical protein